MADYTLSAKGTYNGSNFNSGISASERKLDGFKSKCSAVTVAIGNVLANIATKGFSVLTNSMDAAVRRVDTLNQFPKMMKNLGYETEVSSAAINRMSDGIEGLPTTLDEIVGFTQQLTLSLNDLEKGTDVALALNDGFITFGAGAEQVQGAITQLNQMITTGKYDMQSWNAINQSAPGFLDAVAASMLGAGNKAANLREALNSGKISSEDFLNTIVRLDKEGGDGIVAFSESAKTATGGIKTSMQNAQTAVTKNLANIINAINGSGAISQFFDGVKATVNSVGKAVLPAAQNMGVFFSSLMDGSNETMNRLADLGRSFVGNVTPYAQSMGKSIMDALSGVVPIIEAAIPIVATLGEHFMRMGAIQFESFGQIAETLMPVIAQLLGVLAPVAEQLTTIFTQVAEAVMPLVTMVAETVIPVIGEIATTIITGVSQILEAASPVIQQILTLIQTYMPQIQTIVSERMAAIKGVVDAVWPLIQTVITTVLNVIQGVMSLVMAVISGDWEGAWNAIKSVVSAVWNGIQNIVSAAINAVMGVVSSILSAIQGLWNAAWSSVSSFLSSTWSTICDVVSSGTDSMMSFISSIPDRIMGFFAGAGTWLIDSGRAIIQGLADGISGAIDVATGAISGVLTAVRNFLPFSPAKKGPFSGHGWTLYSGRSIVEALADGIRSREDRSVQAAESMTQSIGAKLNMFASGTWTYGYHAAINYADGLSSGTAKVESASKKITSSVSADMKNLSAMAQSTSKTVSGSLWDMAKGISGAYEYTMPASEGIYDAMKKLDDAGYTVDSYIAKWEELAGKSINWKRTIPKDQQDAFVKEVAKFQELQKTINMSADDLKHWGNGMGQVVIEMTEGISSATSMTAALKNLSSRGITYSQKFVDAFANGSSEYQGALTKMAEWTDGEVQAMVDSYDGLLIAEREQELAARELYINSLTCFDMKKPKEWLLDFQETVLDVKESINSNEGLSTAFDNAATSIDGFALDLNELEVTMEDFRSFQESWTSTVSDGFSQMSRESMTSLADWTANLNNNIAEAQEYSRNLQTVFSRMSLDIDSEAFRKAVYEDGYQKWGQVIADMASKSAGEIRRIVELYNTAIAEGKQSAITQMQAISPGEELVRASIEAILEQEGAMMDATGTITIAGAEAALELRPEYYSTGQNLADGIAQGIQSKVASIAAAAAAAVTAAIQSAKAAAEIASPSKVMSREVGAMLMAGGAVGIECSSHLMTSAMSSAMGGVLATAESMTELPSHYSYNTNAAANEPVTGNLTTFQFGDINVHAIVREEADAEKVARKVTHQIQRDLIRGGYE